MPVQAIPLALISSLYPLGLAAILLLAQTGRPRPKVGVFLIGALACTLTVGFVVVFVLHDAGIGQGSEQSDQYWLRLAICVVFLAGAPVLAPPAPPPKRRPAPAAPAPRPRGPLPVLAGGAAAPPAAPPA